LILKLKYDIIITDKKTKENIMKKNIISEIKEKYNVKENFSLMMEDENKILEILNGNAVFGENGEEEDFDWNFALCHHVPFLNRELVKEYEEIKKISSFIGNKAEFKINDSKIQIKTENDLFIITSEYKLWEKYGEVRLFILKNHKNKIELGRKLELSDTFRISIAENGTYLDYYEGLFEYCDIEYFDFEKRFLGFNNLKKLKKLSPEEIKEVEKLGVTVLREEDVLELEMLEKTASKYISEKDAEFLKKYVTAFKNKWENFQKENA
jgi:hypothetical protein